jgi:hypothetical protein
MNLNSTFKIVITSKVQYYRQTLKYMHDYVVQPVKK